MKHSRTLVALLLLVLAASQTRSWAADEEPEQDLLSCPSQTWHMYMPDIEAAHTADRSYQFNNIELATHTGKFDDHNWAREEPSGPFLSTEVPTSVSDVGRCNSATNSCNDAAAATVVAGVILAPNHCAEDAAQSLAYRKSFFEQAKSIPGLQIECEAQPNQRLLRLRCGPVPAPRLSGGS